MNDPMDKKGMRMILAAVAMHALILRDKNAGVYPELSASYAFSIADAMLEKSSDLAEVVGDIQPPESDLPW